MNSSDILQTKILSDLKEIADEYGLMLSSGERDTVITFIHKECGMCDPAFTIVVEYDVKQVNILNLGKVVELHKINDYVRMLAECIV